MKTKTQIQTSELKSRPEQLRTEPTDPAQPPTDAASAAGQTILPAQRMDDREPLPKLDFAKRHANRQLPTEAVVSLLRTNAPDFFALAEVVGQWVWVRFADRQPRQITRQLAELGFHWNNQRQAWQHPCGHFTRTPSSYDPRRRYGSYFPAQTPTA